MSQVGSRGMTLDEALCQLEALGDEPMRAHNAKHGAGAKQLDVQSGDIRGCGNVIQTCRRHPGTHGERTAHGSRGVQG